MDEGIKSALREMREEINVDNDHFSSFLYWLVEEKNYSAKSIIAVVVSPHKYMLEWEVFLNWVYDTYYGSCIEEDDDE